MSKQYYDEHGNPVDIEEIKQTEDGKEIIDVKNSEKENNGCVKWGCGGCGVILLFPLIVAFSPLLLIVAIFMWRKWEREDDPRASYAKLATIISAVLSVFLVIALILDDGTENNTSQVENEAQVEQIEEQTQENSESDEPEESSDEDSQEDNQQEENQNELDDESQENEQPETDQQETDETGNDSEDEVEQDNEQEENQESNDEQDEPTASTEETLASNANEIFDDNLQDFEFEENLGIIHVNTDLPSGWSENSMRRSFYLDVIDYAEAIEGEEFDELNVYAETTLVDQYGNEDDSQVLSVRLSHETIDRINFDNFNVDNMESVADATFVHPAFR